MAYGESQEVPTASSSHWVITAFCVHFNSFSRSMIICCLTSSVLHKLFTVYWVYFSFFWRSMSLCYLFTPTSYRLFSSPIVKVSVFLASLTTWWILHISFVSKIMAPPLLLISSICCWIASICPYAQQSLAKSSITATVYFSLRTTALLAFFLDSVVFFL